MEVAGIQDARPSRLKRDHAATVRLLPQGVHVTVKPVPLFTKAEVLAPLAPAPEIVPKLSD